MPGDLTAHRSHPVEGWLALIGGLTSATLTGTLTLDASYGNLLRLDPGGASRDVVLPAEASSKGRLFVIASSADAAENLVVKSDGGDTIVTIGQLEIAAVHCDGTTWATVAHFDGVGAPLTGTFTGDVSGGLTASSGDFVRLSVQTIDMNDAAVALIESGTPGAGEVLLTGQVLVVDPNSGGANETLTLPDPSATLAGTVLVTYNGGGESLLLALAGVGTIATLAPQDSLSVVYTSTAAFPIAAPFVSS